MKTWDVINNLKIVSKIFESLALEISGNLKTWESWIYSKDIHLEDPPAPFSK